MSAAMFATLLAALRGAPSLPGARCRGRSHLFDPPAPREDPEVVAARHAQALGLCHGCESLDPCRTWVDGLPRGRRPLGVTAGQVRVPRTDAS